MTHPEPPERAWSTVGSIAMPSWAGPSLDRAALSLAARSTDEGAAAIVRMVEAMTIIEDNPTETAALDRRLTSDWTSDAPQRCAVWATAADGRIEALQLLVWSIERAIRNDLGSFASVLALELRDAARTVERRRFSPERSGISREPLDRIALRQWSSGLGVRPIRTADLVVRPEPGTVTRMWLRGLTVDPDAFGDAAAAAGLACGQLVVALDGHTRRHVLEPRHLARADSLGSEAYCVDLLTGSGGWLAASGSWTPIAGNTR